MDFLHTYIDYRFTTRTSLRDDGGDLDFVFKVTGGPKYVTIFIKLICLLNLWLDSHQSKHSYTFRTIYRVDYGVDPFSRSIANFEK